MQNSVFPVPQFLKYVHIIEEKIEIKAHKTPKLQTVACFLCILQFTAASVENLNMNRSSHCSHRECAFAIEIACAMSGA